MRICWQLWSQPDSIRTHATELAGLFTLRVLLRMPRLATLWGNENGKSHATVAAPMAGG